MAEAPPRTSRRFTASATARTRRRTLTIRHVSGHRIVALVEIVSPANKDRARHVEDLAIKSVTALSIGIHLLMVDLFPPGPRDREGMHGAIWQQLDEDAEVYSPSLPLTLASYVAGTEVEAFVEHLSVSDVLVDMAPVPSI